MFEKKGTYVPKKGTEKVPVEEPWFASELIIFHCIGLYHISHYHTQSQYSNMTIHDTEIMYTPQRRHKHLFEEHLFPRLTQKTSVDSHRNQPSNSTGPVYPRRFPLNCPPCNDERRTEGILLDMYKDASIGLAELAEHPPANPGRTATRWKFKGKLRQACTTSRISPYSTRLRPYCSNLAGKHHGDPQGSSSITSSNIQWDHGMKVGSFSIWLDNA